jgi:hypothetical protein
MHDKNTNSTTTQKQKTKTNASSTYDISSIHGAAPVYEMINTAVVPMTYSLTTSELWCYFVAK